MIWLIRHGEAAAGWGDHPDPGLSELGKDQARAVADTLKIAGVAKIVSSPLTRCQETAQPLADLLGINVDIEPGVGEVVTPEGVEDRVAWLQSVMAGQWSEVGYELQAWRRSVLDTLQSFPDNTAVFSHFVAKNAAVSLIEGSDKVMHFRPGNCAITQLEKGGDGKLSLNVQGKEAETRVL